MLFDENTQQWAPRYGYKRAKDDLDQPFIEIKEGQNPYEPIITSKDKKNSKVLKNLKNQRQNQLRISGRTDPIVTKSKVPGNSIDLLIQNNTKTNKKRKINGVESNYSQLTKKSKNVVIKEELKNALQIVQHSSQSLGRFDKARIGEPDKKLSSRKRVFRDNFQNLDNEKNVMKSQLRIVNDSLLKKKMSKNRDNINSLLNYEGILPDAPENEFKNKKGRVRIKTK